MLQRIYAFIQSIGKALGHGRWRNEYRLGDEVVYHRFANPINGVVVANDPVLIIKIEGASPYLMEIKYPKTLYNVRIHKEQAEAHQLHLRRIVNATS